VSARRVPLGSANLFNSLARVVGTTANAGHRPLADSYQLTFDARTTTLVLIRTRS
jgi:hypothetical protein